MMANITSKRFAGETVHTGAGVMAFGEDGALIGDATPEVVAWAARCKDVQVIEGAQQSDTADHSPDEGFDVATAKRHSLLEKAKELGIGLPATATNDALREAITEALREE